MSEQREYWPSIRDGSVARRFDFADYRAIVVTDVQSPGPVEYLYVMLVFKVPENRLVLCVTSEKNQAFGIRLPGDPPSEADGSHFLCLFPGQIHVNLGSSNDWADFEKFTARALELAREHLKVSDTPVEQFRKRPWWQLW